MEINGMLPIGSVVLLENSKKKVMVVGLAQRSAQNPGRIYDYVGVVFPEGFLDASKMILFNNNNIDQVFMIGYQDAEELSFKMRMDEALRKLRTEGEDEDTTALIRDVVPTRFHVTLVNEENPEDKHEIELSNSIIIGRKPVCDIVLENDKSVSRKHCRLFINEGLVYVEDMGSTNGTSVNDTKILEATEIRTGDAIAMGRKRFIVSIQK